MVNPAGGAREFEEGDLRAIYRRCGPTMARIVIEALADAAADTDRVARCHCADEHGGSLLREFAPHARYGEDRPGGELPRLVPVAISRGLGVGWAPPGTARAATGLQAPLGWPGHGESAAVVVTRAEGFFVAEEVRYRA